ncbi:hypothetical protein [Planococcus alpniumensis]|uniref:hypothetical protein n=1 Tax=Planococcus alpniumensis TaxID=2708345 RepID=UPI001B8C787C|nr:hypothetical protein [Planococcus sp. MSAK28401]
MKTHYYIASPGVLGVKTNIKKFGWSYGHNIPEGTMEQYERCVVRMQVELKEFNDDAEHEGMGKYHYFSGMPGADKIYYTRNYAGIGSMRIRAEGFLTDEPKITVNHAYYKLIIHRIMNLHSIPYIMTDLATLLLLKKGYAPIHCSAFKKDNSTVTVFAPSNTGKTLSCMTACMQYGAEFIAEDMAITDGNAIHSVPWTNSFRDYSAKDLTGKSKSSHVINRLSSIGSYFNNRGAHQKEMAEYLSHIHLSGINKVTHIAILERGDNLVRETAEIESLQKIMNLNRYIFNYLRSPLLTAYEFFNPELSIDQALANEREILTKLIRGSEKVFSVKKNNATHYAAELLEQIGSPIAPAPAVRGA